VCGICQDGVLADECAVGTCRHAFHQACILDYTESNPAPDDDTPIGCPVCYQPLSVDFKPPEVPMESPSATKPTAKAAEPPKVLKTRTGSILTKLDLENFSTSSKIECLTKLLKGLEKGEKSIVFSQYTNMIDIVEWRLHKANIKTVKLLGSMPINMRRSMLKTFREDPSVDVILMSLKAGGEGLNLQVATHVFVLEPWWNPAVEAQAIQRAHRIGQTKAVKAYRFCTEGTIEEKMHKLQEKKQLVFDGTIDSNVDAIRSLTKDDLAFLFRG